MAVKINEARDAVNKRFEYQSITWDRYMGIVDDATDATLHNLDMMARRINLLDEKEYASLVNPVKAISARNVNTDRLDFYNENKRCIDQALLDNETMFNKLDRLSIELRKSADNQAGADAVIQDIEDITEQVKYYN